MSAVPRRLILPVNATHLLLGQIVGQVCNHDLGLGGNTIGGGAALTALAGSAGLVGLLGRIVSVVLVGDIAQWLNLSGRGGGSFGCGSGGSSSGCGGSLRGSGALLLGVLITEVSIKS